MFTGTTTVPPGSACSVVGKLNTGSGPGGEITSPVGIAGTCGRGVPDRNELIKVTSGASTLPLPLRSPTITGSANWNAVNPPSVPNAALVLVPVATAEMSDASPPLRLPSPDA